MSKKWGTSRRGGLSWLRSPGLYDFGSIVAPFLPVGADGGRVSPVGCPTSEPEKMELFSAGGRCHRLGIVDNPC
jgi:hypothetical protein